MSELVSIVVVSYNSADTVIDTLESIKNQTYKNIEVIISDDCSTDETVSLEKEWIKNNETRFSNIVLIESPYNTGVTQNCNRGFLAASGEYIQDIAADDILIDNAIETRLYYQKLNPNKIIITRVKCFGDYLGAKRMDAHCKGGYSTLKKDNRTQYRKLLIYDYIAGPSGGFFSREILDRFGYFDTKYPMMEDYPFLIKLLENGYSFFFVDIATVMYRISKHSLSQSNCRCAFKDSYDAFFFDVRSHRLLKEKMYYEYLFQSILSFRYHILCKHGKNSLAYRISFILIAIKPKEFFVAIINKIKMIREEKNASN